MNFRDFIPFYFDSLKLKNFDFLLKCFNLKEAYQDISIDLNLIEKSLFLVKLSLKDSFSEEDFFDSLNNEFLNVGVFFEKFSDDLKRRKFLYEDAGIVEASFEAETNFIKILVSNSFIDKFKKDCFSVLSKAILSIFMHEETHKQQFVFSRGKMKGTTPEISDLRTEEHFRKYLENPIEIDAHAREVAIFLFNKNFSGKKIVSLLKVCDKLLFESTAFEKYWKIFGMAIKIKGNLDSDAVLRIKVWKRFLKRIVAYLQTTNKYKFSFSETDF